MGIIKQIYRVGIPAIVMQSIASVMTFGLNQILISYTATAAAVMGVYFKIQSFIFMPVFGLNNGMIPIIGYNLGAGRPERIRKAIHYSLGYATAIMAAGFVLSQVFAVEIMAMFNASEHMMSIGVTALRVISFGYLSASVSVIYSAVFQALGRGMESLVISFFRQLIVLLPAACILAAMFGLDALWWSFPISGDNGGIDGMGMVETYPQADGGAGVRVRNTGIMQKWVSKTCKPVNSMVL